MDMPSIPLAERVRPRELSEYIGQDDLLGPQGIIFKFIENQNIPSMIFWGPPGVGKTTLAFLIAQKVNLPFVLYSAINTSVKDIRDLIAEADQKGKMMLFLDEIHRFNKSQQDSLLKAVEEGKIILVGATTENPSFEVNKALLSRCRVYILKELESDELQKMVLNAIERDEFLRSKNIVISEWEAILRYSSGDGRKLLNILELFSIHAADVGYVMTNEYIEQLLKNNIQSYDKSGEMHYDIISAFIKSMRGSDADASVYWLTRMIDAGEDPKFIARRMLIFASEDIGMANPNALLLANSCFDAVQKIGYPECSIVLSHTVVYLATSAKSNATYMALRKAQQAIREQPNLPVPLHLRNAPTALMKKLDYGKDYKYAHNYEGNFVDQEFLPKDLKTKSFYTPGQNPREIEVQKEIQKKWGTKKP